MVSRTLLILLFLGGCAREVHEARPQPPVAPAVLDAPRSEPPLIGPAPEIAPPPPLLIAGQRTFFLEFEPGSDDITVEMRRTVQQAAHLYWATGAVVVALSEEGTAARPVLMRAAWAGGSETLLERRVEAARTELIVWRVWSRPVVRAADDSWREWSPGEGGPVFLLLGPRPEASPAPTPGDGGPGPGIDRAPEQRRPPQNTNHSAQAVSWVRTSAAVVDQAEWLFEDRTLLLNALEILLAECRRQRGQVTAECAAAARAGGGGFAGVPAGAIDEFVFLLRRCAGIQDERECVGEMRMEREYRALNRGRLDPGPLTMAQGERRLFTAKVRYDETIRGRLGAQIGEEGGGGSGVTPQTPAGTIIPYTREMCFTLKAEQEDAFIIERVTPECVKAQPGGRVLFDPQWWVTPRHSGRLGLVLVTELVINGRKRDYPHDPTPLIVEVSPAPDWLARLDQTLDRLTKTVNRATGLAKAIGALIAAVSAWGIWAFFRRRSRRRGARADQSGQTAGAAPAARKPSRRGTRADESEDPA